MPPTDPSTTESYSTFWNSVPSTDHRSGTASAASESSDAYADFHAAIEEEPRVKAARNKSEKK
jgi:hypothetical protein